MVKNIAISARLNALVLESKSNYRKITLGMPHR
jgi:hypothetical protein